MKKKTIVLGLGNPLMGDEGIGIKLIEKLESASGNFPEADFVDAGTGGMSLLHLLSGRKRAVIIDCCIMGQTPGTIRRFGADEVKSVKQLAHVSLHEADVLKIIELAKRLGDCPEEIVFFGIEPAVIEGRIGLSDVLSEQLDHYAAEVTSALR
jgi:hydrogenase maturation protease